ncbi:MAG: response regulator [bacterium]
MTEKNNLKILIVDDDKFLIDMYSLKFSQEGYQVSVAGNGQEAVDKIEKGEIPDIFLLDVIMPVMDGFALAEEIKKRASCSNAAVVILSNLGSKEDIDRGLALGIDGYIIKASSTPSEVVSKVADIIKTKNKN